MKTLVVYESEYGNTEQIARAIAIGADGALNYVWPVALVAGGLYLILRAFGQGRRPRPHA